MIVNATRSTPQIQSHALSLIPSKFLFKNYACFAGRDFRPFLGFKNSLIISCGSTLCTIYFSTMTAFALVAYDWKLRKPFFTVIMAVLMIPAQVTSIGFYQFMHNVGWLNNYLPLILPSIAAPTVVFFMRQYMIPSLPMEILQSARIDGAGEFRIFNQIVLPMMKPAMATQAIFAFVASWNQLFLPQVLLSSDKDKYTMPMMVSQLKGDIYKVEVSLTVIHTRPKWVLYILDFFLQSFRSSLYTSCFQNTSSQVLHLAALRADVFFKLSHFSFLNL